MTQNQTGVARSFNKIDFKDNITVIMGVEGMVGQENGEGRRGVKGRNAYTYKTVSRKVIT